MKVALTETVNAYRAMPERVEDLERLEPELDAIRRANLDHHVGLIEAAARSGARAIGLGELFTGPYFALTRLPMWQGLAEDAARGPTATALLEASRRLEVTLVAPIYERASDGRRYNTALVIDRGTLLGRYRKSHLPEGANEQNRFNEPFYYGPSDAPPYFPVFETSAGRIGVAICYDRHFEGVVRSLAANGAELIFSPAVTFGAKSERMWEMEFEVDAARHNVFIAGSNRRGSEPPWNQPYFGRSHVAGPNGRAPAEPAPEGLVIATVDLDQLCEPDPSGWKLIRDRRPSIYVP
jgi:N-carbamoylputrescine amidase